MCGGGSVVLVVGVGVVVGLGMGVGVGVGMIVGSAGGSIDAAVVGSWG